MLPKHKCSNIMRTILLKLFHIHRVTLLIRFDSLLSTLSSWKYLEFHHMLKNQLTFKILLTAGTWETLDYYFPLPLNGEVNIYFIHEILRHLGHYLSANSLFL